MPHVTHNPDPQVFVLLCMCVCVCVCVQYVHSYKSALSVLYSISMWLVYAEGVSFGTLQGWLIPEHGWLEARGGSGGEGGVAGQGQWIPESG